MNRITIFISSMVLFISIIYYSVSFADNDEDIGHIINVMKMYEQSFNNGKGKYIYELTRSHDGIKYLKSEIDKEKNNLIAEGIDPQNINITSHLLYHINCIFEGEKIRCDIEKIDPGSGPKGSEIWIYNREDTKLFYNKIGHKGLVFPGCHIMKGYQFRNEYNFLNMSYLSCYKNETQQRLSTIIENAYSQKNSDYFDLSIIEKVYQDSLECIVISFSENNNGNHINHKLWLTPTFSYMPIRHIIDDGEIVVKTQYRKNGNGIIFPSKIDKYIYSESKSFIITHIIITLEDNWEFNTIIPNNQFQMNIPQGTPVYDERYEKHYLFE